MLDVDVRTWRLFLHVLAASVWAGGQLTLVGLLPTVRAMGPDASRSIARAFNRIAWSAFAVLVATGVWNLWAVSLADTGSVYQVTLGVKLVVVALSGLGAFLHARARTRVALAVWGALSGVAAVGAVFLGVMLHG